MAEIGQSHASLAGFKAAKAFAQVGTNHTIDRATQVPADERGDKAGTACLTNTVFGTICNAASTQEAQRLAEYYEAWAERSCTTQHWRPA